MNDDQLPSRDEKASRSNDSFRLAQAKEGNVAELISKFPQDTDPALIELVTELAYFSVHCHHPQ